jgi:hypothetical protein
MKNLSGGVESRHAASSCSRTPPDTGSALLGWRKPNAREVNITNIAKRTNSRSSARPAQNSP